MPRKISRREFLGLSVTAGAGAVLAACTPATPTAAPATATATSAPTLIPTSLPPTATAAPVDLRFVWWGGQTRADITTKVIKMFEAKYPNVKFTYEFLDFNAYWTKMTTEAAEAGLPDLMQHGSPTLMEWARNKQLYPLDEYIASGVVNVNGIPESIRSQGTVDGKIYGMSVGSNANGFVIDLDAFEKAGIDVPPDTWTWGDFEKITIALKEKLGIWGYGMYLHHIDLWRVLYAGYDTDLYSKDGKSLLYADDQPLIDHMQMILRLQDAKAIPQISEEAEAETLGPEAQLIVGKKCAMDWLAGSNQLVAMWTATGEDRHLKIMPIPRSAGKKQGLTIRPSQFEAVTANSKNPEWAARFLDFFVNDVEANKVLNAERGVPINTKVLETLAADAGPAQKAVYDYLARLAQDSSPFVLVLDPKGVEDVRTKVWYPEFTEPVRSRKITPEEAVVTLRQHANEILAAANV